MKTCNQDDFKVFFIQESQWDLTQMMKTKIGADKSLGLSHSRYGNMMTVFKKGPKYDFRKMEKTPDELRKIVEEFVDDEDEEYELFQAMVLRGKDPRFQITETEDMVAVNVHFGSGNDFANTHQERAEIAIEFLMFIKDKFGKNKPIVAGGDFNIYGNYLSEIASTYSLHNIKVHHGGRSGAVNGLNKIDDTVEYTSVDAIIEIPV